MKGLYRTSHIRIYTVDGIPIYRGEHLIYCGRHSDISWGTPHILMWTTFLYTVGSTLYTVDHIPIYCGEHLIYRGRHFYIPWETFLYIVGDISIYCGWYSYISWVTFLIYSGWHFYIPWVYVVRTLYMLYIYLVSVDIYLVGIWCGYVWCGSPRYIFFYSVRDIPTRYTHKIYPQDIHVYPQHKTCVPLYILCYPHDIPTTYTPPDISCISCGYMSWVSTLYLVCTCVYLVDNLWCYPQDISSKNRMIPTRYTHKICYPQDMFLTRYTTLSTRYTCPCTSVCLGKKTWSCGYIYILWVNFFILWECLVGTIVVWGTIVYLVSTFTLYLVGTWIILWVYLVGNTSIYYILWVRISCGEPLPTRYSTRSPQDISTCISCGYILWVHSGFADALRMFGAVVA